MLWLTPPRRPLALLVQRCWCVLMEPLMNLHSISRIVLEELRL